MNNTSNVRPWTLEELTFLYDQRRSKTPYSVIASSLRRTEKACECKFREYDWTKFENSPIFDNFSVPDTAPANNWSDEDLLYLYNQRILQIPYKVIARHIGRSQADCQDTHRKTDWASMGLTGCIANKLNNRRIETFRAQTEKTVEHSLDKFRMRTDAIADAFVRSARTLPPADLVKWTPSNRKEGHSSEDMGLLLSDLHIGHEHSLDETGGISQYNVEIFRERMTNLKQAVGDIYELHSQLYKIPKLNIFCLGDIVDGMNEAGAWSPVYITTPITEQVSIGVQELSNAIWYWLTIFEEIEFYGIRGNHGRIAKSGSEKDFANWDIIIYDFLRTEFRDNPRIKFHVPKTWWHMAEIRHHNFLMLHGDDVKSKNPPILSFLEVERKMAGYIKNQAHYTLAGHFHNASEVTSSNGKILMNGSFVGSDVYSLKNCLPGTRAEQKVFGIHNQRGLTFRYDIDLDYEREKSKSVKGVSRNDSAS